MTRRLPRLLIATAMLALAASATAAPLTVTGRAIAENPDARVTVELLPRLAHYAAAAARLAGDEQPVAVVSTRARADGSFSLTVPAAGMWTLRASSPGHVARGFGLEPLVGDQAVPEVVLATAPARELRIADEAGSPLASVLVTAWGAPSDSLGDDAAWYAAVVHRWSDETGRVTLPPLADQSRLMVERPGFLDLELDLTHNEAAVVRLARGTTRELLVLGPTGRPEPEVLVFVGRSWLPSGTSDAAGRLRVAAPDEVADLVFFAREGRHTSTRLEPAAPDSAEPIVELRLPAMDSVAGRVVEEASGDPVAGAFVWSAEEPAAFTTTGPRGDFLLDAASDHRTTLRAAAADHFPTRVRLEPSTGRELGEVTLSLAPAAVVRGRVVDPDGRPLAGAEVTVALGHSGAGRHGPVVTTHGPDGTFRLELVPDGPYSITARHAGFGPATSKIIAGAAARDDLELRLVPARSAAGRLLDLEERPVAGGEIRLTTQSAVQRMPFGEEAGGQVAYSDTDGRFVVEDLGPGSYDLEASAAGYASLDLPGIAIGEAETTEIGDLLLAAGAEITGRVVDPDGRPVADAAIYLPQSPDASLTAIFHFDRPETHSSTDGTFRIVDRRPGERFDLAVHREGFAPAAAPAVLAGGKPVEVVLLPVGTVHGRVMDGSGRAIVGARVEAGPSGRMPGSGEPTRTDAEGRFTLAVEPGATMVAATADGFQAASIDPVEVPPGGEVRALELVLQPGAAIEGEVRTAGGDPVSGAMVLVEPTQAPLRGGSRHGFAAAQSEADGSFSLDGLAAGSHALTAQHPQLGQARRNVELAVGANRLDLILDSGHEVTGRVVDAAGAPVAGAIIEVRAIGDRATRFGFQDPPSSDADGSFRLPAIADGRYRLLARAAEGGRSPALEIEVAGADLGGLLLELPPQATIRGRILGVDLSELGEIQLEAMTMMDSRYGVIDPRGGFEIKGATAGHWLVRATTPAGRSASAQLEVPPGAVEARVDLDFSGELTLTGRVLRDGTPVAGMEVMMHGSETGIQLRSVTDPQGRFRLGGLAAGGYFVSVMAPNTGRPYSERVEITENLEHDIVFETATISGQVVEAVSGAPIPRAIISLLSRSGDGLAETLTDSAESDSRGHFRFTSFVAGSHRLIVTADGYAIEETTLELALGDRYEDLMIPLDAAPGMDLQISARGMPQPTGIVVDVLAADGRLLTSDVLALDATGTAHLGILPAGIWTLVVTAEGAAPVLAAVEVPGPSVTVVLEPEARLDIVVTDLVGDEEQGTATLSVTDTAGNPAPPLRGFPFAGSQPPIFAGRTTVPSLPAGTWTVTAQAPDGRTWSATVILAPGERRELVLE